MLCLRQLAASAQLRRMPQPCLERPCRPQPPSAASMGQLATPQTHRLVQKSKDCTVTLLSHWVVCDECIAGAVNHNLQAMKQRVNTTLVTFESVTRALEATTTQLRKEQAHAVRSPLFVDWLKSGHALLVWHVWPERDCKQGQIRVL